jgi:phage portal protein BeeE
MDMSAPIDVSNDKAQFLETRKHQRSVIAGAFGVPPHLVGDLDRATYNNVEQQSLDMQMNVILPYAMLFEAAMEQSLLTPADRSSGVIIRFNMDALLRGDFKTRQDGLAVQRDRGIISANEWRERENMNPVEEEWADKPIMPANFIFAGEPLPEEGVPPKEPLVEETVDDPKGFDAWEYTRKLIAEARHINLG